MMLEISATGNESSIAPASFNVPAIISASGGVISALHQFLSQTILRRNEGRISSRVLSALHPWRIGMLPRNRTANILLHSSIHKVFDGCRWNLAMAAIMNLPLSVSFRLSHDREKRLCALAGDRIGNICARIFVFKIKLVALKSGNNSEKCKPEFSTISFV